MTTSEYIISGILAGSSAKMLIEQLSQLKADKARSVAKTTGLPIEQVTAIAEIDPTANGGYIQWLAKCFKQANLPNSSPMPSPEEIQNDINAFEIAKRIPDFTGNKNILTYGQYDDFKQIVTQSERLQSSKKKEEAVKDLFDNRIQKEFSNFNIVRDHLTGEVISKKAVYLTGYYPWLMYLVKTNNIVLPEDAEAVMSVIRKFEAKVADENFHGAKNIASYRTIQDLSRAVTRGETAEVVNRDRIPDAPGVKLLGTSTKYGHFYELYAVTTSEQGRKLFDKSNMGRRPDGSEWFGWCVKDPHFFTGLYHLGPKNPAYVFRRDGLTYALADILSGDIMDRDNIPANSGLTVELIGSFWKPSTTLMPEKLFDKIVGKNPWSQKNQDEIKKNGIDKSLDKMFSDAEGDFGDSSSESKKAADNAISFLTAFEWSHPTAKALTSIYKNAWLAMGYAMLQTKDWQPGLHPIIGKNPGALGQYYDFAMKLGLPRSGYPEYKELAMKYAERAAIKDPPLDKAELQLFYLPLAHYMKNNPEEIDSIDPELLNIFKQDMPFLYEYTAMKNYIKK